MRTLLALLVLSLPACTLAQPGDDAHGITLERIMSDPDWIGLFPQNAYWSDDGGRVIFGRKRAGSSLEDLIELDPETLGERVLSDAERSAMGRANWVYDPERARRLCNRGGDLWLGDVASGEIRQLTRTSAHEGSPAFMADSELIRYESGGQWYVMDLDDAGVFQVADVRFEDEPKDEEDGDDYLDRQQEKLFTTLVERQERGKEREAQREAIDKADASAVPGPFYLGKGLERRGWALSDDGKYLAVIASKPAPDVKQDVMPSYVTEDGYVETSRVRAKVGVGSDSNERLFLLDLTNETFAEVDLSDLPGIADDPLAFLKKADDAPQPEGDPKEDAKAQEPKPRGVDLRGLTWQPGGGSLVVQAWSHDHKDRWIVEVKAGEKPEARSIFRDSTEAWINWRVGEAGWTSDGNQFWFLSEEPGFAHVHAWDGSSVRQVTSGEYEVWDVSEDAAHPGVLYARTNRPDPSIYELARISLDGDAFEVLTDFKAGVERFRVSDEGSRVLMEVSTLDHPAELYVMPLGGKHEPKRLTHSVSEAFSELPWVKPEFVDIPCREGRSVRARVYDFAGGGMHAGERPGVIFVHGAGYTQNVDRGWPYYFREMMFHSLLAYKGYVVVDLDYRASAGYGQDFRTAIYRHMGKPEIEDMVDAARWMTSERGVGASRVGTYGGSYGGFLAIMAVFKEPDVFRAGAALRPVTDWAHYNQGYTSAILNTPDIDPEAYEQSSPIEFAEGFRGGLLICHGVLDDNVLVQDSIRLQQRLIELGKEDWEVALYPLESHGFVEPSAWLDEYRRIFGLFEERLGTPEP